MDRVLINDHWLLVYRDARVENLPIIGSDHGPIVLHLDKRNISLKVKAFRREEFWFHIPEFIDVVKDAWNTHFVGSNAFQLVKKIQAFRQKVKAWNKLEVGNVEENIKQLMRYRVL